MFNIEEFDIKLETKKIGRNFIYTEEIDSTNKFLLDESDELAHGTTVLSEEQTAGRGRLNRPWFSGRGLNLTFSVLLNEKLDKYNPNHLSLASALAVAGAIENLYQLKTDLKWPNDVLVDNKKISGILLESSSKGSELEKIVIGIGINVNQTKFTDEYRITPTSIKSEAKKEIKRERLLSEVLNLLEDILKQLRKSPKIILEEWRDKCRMIGEHIKLEIDEEKKFGIFYDIDANGYLILKVGDKLEKITSGDITVRNK